MEENKVQNFELKEGNKINYRSKEFYDLVSNFKQYNHCLNECSDYLKTDKDDLTRKENFCVSNLKRKLLY